MNSEEPSPERHNAASSGHKPSCTTRYAVPQWFLENIQSAHELGDKDARIWLRNENPSGINDSRMITQPSSECQPTESTTEDHSHCFQFGKNRFEMLLDIVASLQMPDRIGRLSPSRSSVEVCSNMRFGLGFLDELVVLVAQELKSSLVSINSQDLEDLALEFYYQDLEVRKFGHGETNNGDEYPCSNAYDSSTAPKAEVEDDDCYDISTIAKKASRCYFGECDDLHSTRQDGERTSDSFFAAIIDATRSKNKHPEAAVIFQDTMEGSCSDASARTSPIILYFRDGLAPLTTSRQCPEAEDSSCMDLPNTTFSRGRRIQDMVRRYRKRGENIAMIFATTHTDVDEFNLVSDSQTPWKISKCECRLCSRSDSSKSIDEKLDTLSVLPLSVPASWAPERETRCERSVAATRIQSFKRRLNAQLFQFPSNPAGLLEPQCDWFSLLPKGVTDRFASLSFTTDVMIAFKLITSRCSRKGIVDLSDLRAILVQMNHSTLLDAAKEDDSIESNILQENEVEEDDLVKGYDYLAQLFSPSRPEEDDEEEEEYEEEEYEDEEERDEEEEGDEAEEEVVGEERKDAEVDHPAYVVQSADKLNADFDITFFDQAALASIKTLIQLWEAENQAALSSFAAQAKSRSILLYGAPGTGKTLLVQAIATTKEFKVINVNNRTIRSADDNIAKDYIRDIFSSAQRNQPCIILIDDVEIIFKRTLCSWEYELTKDFMDCLDALKRERSSSFVLATTNQPWIVNTNFSRRMHQVPMQLPDAQARMHIINSSLKKENMAIIDADKLETATEDFSVAELQDLCSQTTLFWAIQRDQVSGQGSPEITIPLTDEHVAEALKNVRSNASESYLESLEAYSRKHGPTTRKTTQNDAWAEFSPQIQKVIQSIDSKEPQESDQPFFWEKKFLSLIVKPKDMQASWSDLAIDEGMEQEIKQIINHHQSGSLSAGSYGLLRRTNTGGAFLYGPPGTGKTQLARALAHDCNMVTICATAADMISKWHGESPKAIKGLFNLGRLLAPSIVFIDEADSLFLKRDDLQYQHQMAELNQFLHEMDGVSSSQKSPFVLLATNLPARLDSAVLRRVPNMFYFGLPNFTLRRRIFEILLKEEIVDTAVSTLLLAAETSGFTGSDIKSLCIRVALHCNEFVEKDGEDKGKRVLTMRMFLEALCRLRPTATKAAISSIRAFAKECHPSAINQMQEYENEEFELKTASVLARNSGVEEAEAPMENNSRVENENNDSSPAPLLSSAPRITPQNDTTEGTLATEMAPLTITSAPDTEAMVPTALYNPLPEGGKTIRVLSIEPRDCQASGTPISCSLEQVDLEDWTAEYRSFHAMLPAFGKDLRLVENRVLQILWLSYNTNPKIVKRVIEIGLDTCAANVPLPLYCDKPMEKLPNLRDRYNWGDYIALSYVWGDQAIKKTILLNDKPFEVGLNLYEALERLSASYEIQSRGLKVWIDAMCINQEDVGEREVEVKKMDLIYSRALAVRGWLGYPPEEVAAELPEFRSTLDNLTLIVGDETYSADSSGMDFSAYQEKAESVLNLMYLDEDKMFTMWSALDGIIAVPYWNRLWVTQEIALGSSILFWYGDFYVTPKELCVLESLMDQEEPIRKLISYIHPEKVVTTKINMIRVLNMLSWTRLAIYESLREGIHQDRTLMNCIDKAVRSEATDPRDKVYGILALLPPSMSCQIHPNYSPNFTWRDAWIEFTKVYLHHQGNLNLLAGIDRTALPSRNDMPSWALNFRTGETEGDMSEARSESLNVKDHKKLHAYYKTSKSVFGVRSQDWKRSCSSDAGFEPSLAFSKDDRLLACMCVFVDEVSHITKMTPHQRMVAGLPDGTDVVQQNTSYGIPCPEAKLSLSRALMCNSGFQWGDEPSIFDIPWFNMEDLRNNAETPEAAKVGSHIRMSQDESGVVDFQIAGDETEWTTNIPWTQILSQEGTLRQMFSEIIHPVEHFQLRGARLSEYFNSEQGVCKDWTKMKPLIDDMTRLLTTNSICETRKELVGWATSLALPGDRIAILFGCNMPVVLRPRADEYEVIGGCFIDGFMNGEARKEVENGRLVPETIALC